MNKQKILLIWAHEHKEKYPWREASTQKTHISHKNTCLPQRRRGGKECIKRPKLSDLGAFQSFTSSKFGRMAGLWVEPILQEILVGLSNEGMVFCHMLVNGCPLVIGEISLEVELIVFRILGFNLILGMDLLFKKFVSINFYSRHVTSWVLGMLDWLYIWSNIISNYLTTGQEEIDEWGQVLSSTPSIEKRSTKRGLRYTLSKRFPRSL